MPMPVPMESAAYVASQTTSYAVGWGTLSLINAGLAQSKNRSGLAWWFVSLFLGPVATFLIVVLDRVEPTERFVPKVERTPPEV
jgi:hypothetical protein